MNIRLSLKIFFFSGMVIYGAAMAYVFFQFAFDLYMQGRDGSVSALMVELVRSTEFEGESTVNALGFTITEEWAEIPEKFRQQMPEPPEVPFELRKAYEFSNPGRGPDEINYVLMVQEDGNKPVYISKTLSRLGLDLGAGEPSIGPYNWTILVGVVTATAFSLLLLLVLRLLVKPLEDLQLWAGALTVDNLQSPAPSFKYAEFSSVAEIVRSSLASVRTSLENEQDFLRYASHELRSPLTAMRSNVELLKKKQTDAFSGQKAIIERIDRATFTMTQLIQTLLWLCHNYRPNLDDEPVALDVLTREAVEELKYLRSGKSVDIQIDTEPYTTQASKSACRIAISNLVRNAFQHTESGVVKISQSDETIIIRNPVSSSSTSTPSEIGFGLGTKLTVKLADQYGWRFSTKNDSNEFVAEIAF